MKLVKNKFVAYLELQVLMALEDTLLERGFMIVSYVLCGSANICLLVILIGVLLVLTPSRTHLIAQIGASTMISGFISTSQVASIAYVLF